MKKYLFLSCFCALMNAQQTDDPVVKTTLRAGWVNSTLTGADANLLSADGKINAVNGYSAGISIDNPISHRVSLKHELFYARTGAEFLRDLNGQNINARLRLNNIRLNPISTAYHIGAVQVYAGPYMNILTDSSITAADSAGRTYRDHEIFGNDKDDQENGQYLQKLDYGVTAGIGYRFNFGVDIDLHFSRGFASIFDNSNTYEVAENRKDLRIYNRQFGIAVGYLF
ncbi:MAG: PorT family protein [Chryseobacterium sp.]|nr:MAG: PorT family protein [Chryseobacterium sp.]